MLACTCHEPAATNEVITLPITLDNILCRRKLSISKLLCDLTRHVVLYNCVAVFFSSLFHFI